MRHKLQYVPVLSTLLLSTLGACAPKFGDGCERSVECSANGDRLCDRSQPGGYCTLANCEPKACGDEGVCVRFRADAPRLSSSWCMATCDSTSDCDRDEYVCRSAAQLNELRGASSSADTENAMAGSVFAEVLDDKKSQKFCVVRQP